MNAVIRNQSAQDGATKALDGPETRSISSTARQTVSTQASAPDQIAPTSPSVNLGAFVVDQPLSSHFPVPATISRMVSAADRDIARGRLVSALDLTMAALSHEPATIGLYVREAELLLATGCPDAASQLVDAIGLATGRLEGPSTDVEAERILTHAHPTDTNVLHLAHTLLASSRVELIDRYLPVAVDAATLQDDPGLALELARKWHEIRPENLESAFCLTREGLRVGEPTEVEHVLDTIPVKSRDARALVVRLVIECTRASNEQWDASAALLSAIESKATDTSRVQALLREMIAVQPSNESLLVHSGVVEVNAGNPEAAHQLLRSVRPAEPGAYYVATVTSARAALAAGDAAAAHESLRRAIELHAKPEIAAFAAECAVLRSPHDIFSVGKSVAGSLQQHGEAAQGAELLEQLSQLNPQREDVSRAYADALAKSGKREIAITRLESMLRQHEQAGEIEAVLLTIHSILQIAPGNLRLRQRLIDEYMKRGMLQEAVQERWTQAQIMERAGRVDDAVEQLRRASDVASVLGDWRKLENILKMMIRIRPEDLDVRHSAATKFIEYGQIRPAIEQLWGVVQIADNSNDPDEAIAALHQIIALGPQEIDAYHKLGEVLASVGEYAQAERVYRRLAALQPDDPAIAAKQSALAAMARGGQ